MRRKGFRIHYMYLYNEFNFFINLLPGEASIFLYFLRTPYEHIWRVDIPYTILLHMCYVLWLLLSTSSDNKNINIPWHFRWYCPKMVDQTCNLLWVFFCTTWTHLHHKKVHNHTTCKVKRTTLFNDEVKFCTLKFPLHKCNVFVEFIWCELFQSECP